MLSHSTTLSNPPESSHAVGNLQGEVWLSLQTYQAQSLVRGRRRSNDKPAIMGLVGFADRLKTLWLAAKQDDPYADWWLVKVEQGIVDCRSRLDSVFESLTPLLQTQPGLQISLAQSNKPQRIALHFTNPYAFRAAQMLAEYDRLMCVFITLRHVGLSIPIPLSEQAEGSGRWIRQVFSLPQGYHCYEINREAVRQNSAQAQKAREAMGEVPEAILLGETKPLLRPASLKNPNRAQQN